MVYYLILSLLIPLSATGSFMKRRQLKIVIICMLLVIVLFCGIRHHSMWTDSDLYYPYFLNPSYSYKDLEPGFRVWNILIGSVFNNYNVYLLLTYAAVLLIYFKSFIQISAQYVPFCIGVFFLTTILSSGGQRQLIAVALINLSMHFIYKRNIIKYILILCVAATFHRTALFMIPLFFLATYNIGAICFLALTILSVIMNKMQCFNMMVEYVRGLFANIPSVLNRINLYMPNSQSNAMIDFGLIKRYIIIFIIFIIIDMRNGSCKEDNLLRTYLNIYMIGTLLSIWLPAEFARICIYMFSAEPILEALAIMIVMPRNKKYMIATFLTINLIRYAYSLRSFYPELFIPYKAFWMRA